MECPICLDSIIDENKTECCNQEIHKECLNKSLESTKGDCPFCRRKFNLVLIVNNELFNNEIIINTFHNIQINQPRRIDGLEIIKCCFAFIFTCLMIFVLFVLPSLYAIIAINYSRPINGTNEK